MMIVSHPILLNSIVFSKAGSKLFAHTGTSASSNATRFGRKNGRKFTLLTFPTAFNSMRCSVFSVSYRQCSVFHLFNPLFACTSGRHSNTIASNIHIIQIVSWMDMYFVRKLLSGTISRKIKYCFISLRNFSTIAATSGSLIHSGFMFTANRQPSAY